MLKNCQLYYTKIEQLPSEDTVAYFLNCLPPLLQKRLLMYKGEKAKTLSLIGKLLLLHGLKNMGFEKEILRSIYYSGNGRPYIKNFPLDFNISHSKNMIVCAITSKCKVGVDIQKIVKISKTAASFFLHPMEQKEMDDRNKIAIWAKKEAMGKIEGNGLGMAFTEIYCPDNTYYKGQKSYYIHYPEIDKDYVCCIAINSKPVNIIKNEVTRNELIKYA